VLVNHLRIVHLRSENTKWPTVAEHYVPGCNPTSDLDSQPNNTCPDVTQITISTDNTGFYRNWNQDQFDVCYTWSQYVLLRVM